MTTDLRVSGEGPLGCSSCAACCKSKGKLVTIFKGELDTDLSPQAPYVQEMEINGDCKYLVVGKFCGIFKDPKRYLTCKAYPFTMGTNNRLYLATTCESYQAVIDGLMKGAPSMVKYVAFMYEFIKDNITPEMAEFWEQQARGRSIVTEINTKAFLEGENK